MIKERKKRSGVWQIDQNELKEVVKSATSISQILIHFGLVKYGRNNDTLKKRLIKEGIDFSHIPQGRGSNKNNLRGGFVARPIQEYLTKNSNASRTALKKRLLKEGLLENKCYECGQAPEWNGRPLVLQLEHKNGDGRDNRLENLEMLCPNCHTQTPTYAGRTRLANPGQ
jgi:hypothetical protein